MQNRSTAISALRPAALMLLAGLSAAAMLAGCNTTAGAGQDISAGGRAVTTGADAVKSKL